MQNLLQLSLSGDVVTIGLNVYLAAVLIIGRLIWVVVTKRGSSGGGRY